MGRRSSAFRMVNFSQEPISPTSAGKNDSDSSTEEENERVEKQNLKPGERPKVVKAKKSVVKNRGEFQLTPAFQGRRNAVKRRDSGAGSVFVDPQLIRRSLWATHIKRVSQDIQIFCRAENNAEYGDAIRNAQVEILSLQADGVLKRVAPLERLRTLASSQPVV